MARFTKREIQKFIKADGISVTAAEQLRLFWAYCLERALPRVTLFDTGLGIRSECAAHHLTFAMVPQAKEILRAYKNALQKSCKK